MGKKEEHNWKIHKVGKEEQTCKVYVGKRALRAGIFEMEVDGWRILGHPTYDLLLPFIYTVAYIRPIREPVKPKPPPPPPTQAEKDKAAADFVKWLHKPPPTKAEMEQVMAETRKALVDHSRKHELIFCAHCGAYVDKLTGICEYCGSPLT